MRRRSPLCPHLQLLQAESRSSLAGGERKHGHRPVRNCITASGALAFDAERRA
jgi:hypothetical protein